MSRCLCANEGRLDPILCNGLGRIAHGVICFRAELQLHPDNDQIPDSLQPNTFPRYNECTSHTLQYTRAPRLHPGPRKP